LPHLIKLEVKVARNLPWEEHRSSRIIVLILDLDDIWSDLSTPLPGRFVAAIEFRSAL